jgi:uncharacterized Zn finger protein
MQAIRTWWGQRFIAALERFTDAARLARGRSYAGSHRIKSWQIKNGEISAKIRGNVNPYFGVTREPTYETTIGLKPIGDGDWTLLIRHLGSRAAYVSRLLLNEMPDTIEKPFELLDLHLLPHSGRDFKTYCSCPDYANPCKHVAGLCYFLSALLDQDPFLLFELRGLPPAKLFARLRETPLGRALVEAREAEQEDVFTPATSLFIRPQPLEPPEVCDPAAYWEGRGRLPSEWPAGAAPEARALRVKKGGDYPEFWKLDLAFPVAMETVYEAIRKRSKEW